MSRAVVVHVVGQDDGAPRPGVPVHVAPAAAAHARTDARGDWITAVDPRVRELRAAATVRSDPEGNAVIELPWARHLMRVFAGAPFEGQVLDDGYPELELRVVQQEPFVVTAVGPDGAPLGDFPVALHAAGKDVSVALTDARGTAVLGVPPGFEARLLVAPAGWVGPRDGFPTVATMLARAGPARLVVPPFGTLRIRALRRGEPVRAAAGTAQLREPQQVTAFAASDTGPAFGFEFGPIAVGVTLTGAVEFDRVSQPFLVEGPAAHGACAVYDFELDPARPKLAFRVVGAGIDAARADLRVCAHTEAGVATASARVDATGRAELDFGPRGLPRARLLRVDFDATGRAPDSLTTTGWSACLSCDHMLADAPLDLGDVALEPHGPVLEGRVVDGTGKGIEGAMVEVEPARGFEAPYRIGVRAGRDGSFRLVGPLFRDAEGRPAPAVATARLGRTASARTAPLAIGSVVTLVIQGAASPPDLRVGGVTARLDGAPPAVLDQLKVELVDADGGALRTAPPTAGEGGVSASFEAVPPGPYALRVGLYDGDAPLAEVDGVEVRPGAVRDDVRIALEDRLTVVTLRVVDPDGVPVAGAHADVWGTAQVRRRDTDQKGIVALALRRAAAPCVTIAAPGLRPLRLRDVDGDHIVRLEQAGTLDVAVRGLPEDLPRDRIEVWARPVERERAFDGPRGRLGDGDVARLPLPVDGGYAIWLLVSERSATGWAGGAFARAEPFLVGAAPAQHTAITLDAAAVERLRAMLRAR